MQLKFEKIVVKPEQHLNRVCGLSWSSNNKKLAVATADRSVLLFDTDGIQRDKFSTKPVDPSNGKTSYVIRNITFSPDSQRLAVAQSDKIVYVYKLGTEWNEKKVICNKFPQPGVIMSMVWLESGPIVIGLDDGRVRALHCKTNKSQNLYNTEKMTVSLAQNQKGTSFLSGHEDGTVVKFGMSDDSDDQSGKLLTHPVSPYAMAWAQGSICIAGCDRKVSFYDNQGKLLRTFDYSRDDMEKEFLSASCNPSGLSVALGSYDRIRLFVWSPRQGTWAEGVLKEIKNIYSVPALSWKRDGTRLTIGTVCGGVMTFESVIRRKIWHDKFEFVFISSNQVLLRDLLDMQNNEGMLVTSTMGMEIDEVRIMGKDNYFIARTENSLLVGDLTRNLTSEVPWAYTSKQERFYFENPNVCLVFNAGELSLIEYGRNLILGSVRTEFVNPHVISVRLNERGNAKNNMKLAYLIDLKTICVMDLFNQSIIAQISHDAKIDWLELNETAQKLLFRDKKLKLFLYDLSTGKKRSLMARVALVQWIIQSDVVVAQCGTNLIVWYNIDLPEHYTMIPIRGEVNDVVREDGKTIVKTLEGLTDHSYLLDEGLVEFGTALNDHDFGRAMVFLENLEDKTTATGMWHRLAQTSLECHKFRAAQRCYAALENASMVYYLQEIIEISENYEEATGMPGINCTEVKAKLALLRGNLREVEKIYLDQGDVESAIKMYKKLNKWDDAIKLATQRGYYGLNELRQEQMSYFLNSGQEDRAGTVLELQGEVENAMLLYMKAKKPMKAARLLMKVPHMLRDSDLVDKIISLLLVHEFYELAGDVYFKLSDPEKAIENYRKCGAFARAIDLARDIAPDDITILEEEWGEWLVNKKQYDAAINHYIEAGATNKALEAAVSAKQWKKALQIAKVLDDPNEIKKYAIGLANHLSDIGDINGAQDILVRAELHKEAVELLNRNGHWEKAYDIAESYLGTEIVRDMFTEMARKLEEENKLKDAEKIYVAISEPDMAINMYKKVEQYDSMIRLIEKYHKNLVESTHKHLGDELQSKGKYKNAEIHYLAANEWKEVVHMYCKANKWEDAHRVAKQKGSEGASNQVAYMWARTLPISSAARLLTKMGLVENAIGFACDSGQFEFALELCRLTDYPAEDVHYKMAMGLEDEGRFTEAEAEFLLANKPKEAILMHTHGGDWSAAFRIAEQYLPEAKRDILIAQGNAALEAGHLDEFEVIMLRAERPDIVIQQYKENDMIDDAMRIAREHMPTAVAEIQRLQSRNTSRRTGSSVDSRTLLQEASHYVGEENFKKAVDCLLKINESNGDSVTVEKALLRSAEICNQFLEGQDAIEVARELGPRLLEYKHSGPAAQLYLAAEMAKEAIDVFIKIENWNKARRLANEIDPELVAYVEAQQKVRLKHDGNVEQLADIDLMGALDLLAEQNQWARCIDKAKMHSSTILHKYLALYATQLIREGDCIGALNLYIVHGAPPLPQNFNIYDRIATECFALREPDGAQVWHELRNFLHSLLKVLANSEHGHFVEKIEKHMEIAHFYAVRAICREVSALQNIGIKISVALLRYTDVIPVDKGFYEAGMDLRTSKDVKRQGEAFVLLNHYLDICEGIEDGSGNLIDHSDFVATDFPSSVQIPIRLHLHNEIRLHEDVRDWILTVSMDQNVDQTLPLDDRNLYESSLGPGDQMCIVSGYPVKGKQVVTFQRSERQANRDMWSKLTIASKMAPHSKIPDLIEFIEKWNGHANMIV